MTTNNTINAVTREIDEMFEFIKGSKNPSEISYERFLGQKSVVTVVTSENEVDASRKIRRQIEDKSVVDVSSEPNRSVVEVESVVKSVVNPGEHHQPLPCGEDRRGTGKIDRSTPARKTPKGQRSPEMETFKRILSGLKEPFTYDRICNICDSAGLLPSKYKTWIQEELDQGRMISNNGNYEVVKEVNS